MSRHNRKSERYQRIIQAIPKKGLRSGGQELKPAGMQYKSGDIPAHGKEPGSQAQERSTVKTYVTQVLRRQEQSIAAKNLCKATVYGAEKDGPEYEQYLVLTEV